ncbi:hypothetical protein Taro_031394 [Colocasia esculenta]|uniref:Uncharacterized protein n=1 Tax=Colocasia esculenta TaxID=4460 RepID=A0A843VUI6_COLES|nr:hypothetical protein [Colocasia esculenta]
MIATTTTTMTMALAVVAITITTVTGTAMATMSTTGRGSSRKSCRRRRIWRWKSLEMSIPRTTSASTTITIAVPTVMAQITGCLHQVGEREMEGGRRWGAMEGAHMAQIVRYIEDVSRKDGHAWGHGHHHHTSLNKKDDDTSSSSLDSDINDKDSKDTSGTEPSDHVSDENIKVGEHSSQETPVRKGISSVRDLGSSWQRRHGVLLEG